jgi:hypothetical protein
MESILGPLGTAATPGLLYLPRVIVRMEKLVEWTVLKEETDVHQKSHLPDPGATPARRGGKSATNRLSYGAARPAYYQLQYRLSCLIDAIKLSLYIHFPIRLRGFVLN